MPASNRTYRVLWFTPTKASVGAGTLVDDVAIGSMECASPGQLKRWIIARDWPKTTVFEVTRITARGEKTVRCYLTHIAAWPVSKQQLPLGSNIDLPSSRRSELQTFEAMLDSAMDYAKQRELLSRDVTSEVRRALLNVVIKEAARPGR